MEQLSAFQAYQNAAKNSEKNKSKSAKPKKQKKPKKYIDDADYAPKAIAQKRKSTHTPQAGPAKSAKPASKSPKPAPSQASVPSTNGVREASLNQTSELLLSQILASVPRANGTTHIAPSKITKRTQSVIGECVLTPVSSTNGSATTSNAKKKKKAANSAPTVQIQRQRDPRTVQRESVPSTKLVNDELTSSSVENGQIAFAQLIAPRSMSEFMSSYWEKKGAYFSGHSSDRFDFLGVSTQSIDKMLRTNHIEFTKNIDVTSYENGVRETHNPDGRALPGSVWDFYRNGCSIRLINPQTFIDPLNKFCASLQECFHCLVGANVYLTPANSQGFAPHYDDIEAFVLQIEGKKQWTLYKPRTDNEELPRESSENFSQDEIGVPVFSAVLQAGDMLYFPRGWIHQAKTVPNQHSLHITLSMYQKTAYADLFEQLTQQALKKAIDTDLIYRRGLPLDIWHNFGVTYSEYDSSPRRTEIKQWLTTMFEALVNHIDIDAAVDKLAIKYQHDALPPALTAAEKARTAFGTKPLIHHNGDVEVPEMEANTEVRLLRANIVRLVRSDTAYSLYYYGDNSKEYHASEMNFIEVDVNTVGVIKALIRYYPAYVKIENLSPNIEESLAVVYSLWDRGLLMTKEPMANALEADSDD